MLFELTLCAPSKLDFERDGQTEKLNEQREIEQMKRHEQSCKVWGKKTDHKERRHRLTNSKEEKETAVVYFKQQMGALHAVFWLKLSFLAFKQVFLSFSVSNEKDTRKTQKYDDVGKITIWSSY